MGFAILWIHGKQKNPVDNRWTSGDRRPWAYLEQTYRAGYNVGVRTGKASEIGHNLFLACIDVDVKDPAFEKSAMAHLELLTGGQPMPTVLSGSGNGSRHLYCTTRHHFKMITVVKEKDRFEICIYSDGRQMVLPPSVHPTGGRYAWAEGRELLGEIPIFEVPEVSVKPERKERKGDGLLGTEGPEADFHMVVSNVDLDWLPLSDKILKGIKDGTDITDRSGFLLPAASALHSCGLDVDEVLSVLTDPAHSLSGCAYDHAQTSDRRRAAYWLWKYTVRKVFAERSAATVFEKVLSGDDPEGDVRLSAEAQKAQTEELMAEMNWKHQLDRTKQGKLLATVNNVVLVLKNDVDVTVVRRNEFAFRDAYSVDTSWGGMKNASLTDDDTAKIKHWLGQTWGVEPGSGTINDGLTVIACENAFDPVKDWLDALPPWDGIARLETWLKDHFEAKGDADYLGQVFKKWVTAMVMRVYRPGAKFDWMPIFEGAQGIGKSSFGRVLVGDQYFLDWLPNLGDKDAALGLQGIWMVEMGELSQFRKNELEIIKAFLTRTVDKFRPPHGKKLIESSRRCVFFGTTNKSEYLRDDSGNRRFKPVKVGRLDFERLREDREQLFAEAKEFLKTCHEMDLELTGDAKKYEAEIHQEKMVEDESVMMLEALDDFIRTEPVFDFDKFRISDLFAGGDTSGSTPLGKWRPDTRNLMFAAKALKKLGAVKRPMKGRNFWKLPGVIPQEGVGVTPPEGDFY